MSIMQEKDLTLKETQKLRGLKLEADVATQIFVEFVNYFRDELDLTMDWSISQQLDRFVNGGNELMLKPEQINLLKSCFIDSQITGSKVDKFVEYLRAKYVAGPEWKIDLEKAVFFKEVLSEQERLERSEKQEAKPKPKPKAKGKSNASKKRKS